jgi:hypothetical protein
MNVVQATLPADDSGKVGLAFCLVAAAIVAGALAWFVPALLQDPDSWWHIKVGQDLLATWTFPTVDTYSHTFAGEPWIAKEWLGQVLLALAYQAGEWNGVVTLVIAAVALTVLLLASILTRWLKPTVAIALAIVAALLIGPIFTARPHVFTLPIIVVWTAALFQAAREDRPPSLWLLPLLVLWANLHATFTLAFVIAAFAGLDLLAKIGFSRPVLLGRWIGFGLLCPLASLVNPYGFDAILATFTVAYGNEAVPLLVEWLPFNASAQPAQAAALLLIFFGWMVTGLRIAWPTALFIAFTLHLYLTHVRFVYPFFLLLPIIVAPELAVRYPALSAGRWLSEPRDALESFISRRLLTLGAVGVALVIGVSAMLNATHRVEPSQKISAIDALAFVRQNGISGNVLNSYGFGGTLIFHEVKTYIDGRTDQLFLDGFMRLDDAMGRSGGKPILEAAIERHAIQWALLSAGDDRIPFFDALGWPRAYADEYAVIYVRPNG